jgi:hypothetical protein
MARLYSNENFPLPAVLELRRLGHDVMTVAEAGGTGHPLTDTEVLAFATKNRRAVITLNRRHFIALHQQQTNHGGIVVCTVDPDFTALARHIHEALAPFHDDLSGQLVRVMRLPT